MKARATITLLLAVCFAEAAFIGVLVWPKPGQREALPPGEAGAKLAGTEPTQVVPSVGAEAAMSPAELTKQNAALTTELAEVKKELDARKSEISFSYGSVRESGRFVGMTFRKMFETAAAREATEAKARAADNQINILSLGPFIQDAEVMESDPEIFAQFQAPLISEVLGIPAQQATEVESLLTDLKSRSLKTEEGSPEWAKLNDTALTKITALLPEGQKAALKPQLHFFEQYGILMIPAYSILRSPAPTVVQP